MRGERHRPVRRLGSTPASRRREWEVRSRRLPPIGAGDAHPLLVLSGTEPELGGGKKPIDDDVIATHAVRSEEHTSELQSLMRISYAVFCLKKKKQTRKK